MKGDVISILTNIGSPVSCHLIRAVLSSHHRVFSTSPPTSASLSTLPSRIVSQPPSKSNRVCLLPQHLTWHGFSILSCSQYVVGSNGTISVEYSKGGQAKIIVPNTLLQNSGLCGYTAAVQQQTKGQLASTALFEHRRPSTLSYILVFVLSLFGLLFSGFGV